MAVRIGQKGIFQTEDNDFYSATALVRPTKELPDITSGVQLKVKRIPFEQLEEIVDQMRYVAAHRLAELYIAMYYSHKEQTYLFVIPEQTPIMGSRVRHGPLPPSPPGYNQIGDLHSHMDGPAHHSSWDDEDDLGMPGIHVIIGDLLSSTFPSISCSAIVGEKRVVFPVSDLFEPPPVKDAVELRYLTECKIPKRTWRRRIIGAARAAVRPIREILTGSGF